MVANGQRLTEVHEITQDFWSQGPQTVRFAASLKAGENHLFLKTDEPLEMLPGNRPVRVFWQEIFAGGPASGGPDLCYTRPIHG
jgi:hypothetical protein